MMKIKLGKTDIEEILMNLQDTVSAGKSIPDKANWYTVLPIGLRNVCRMRKDLSDMDSMSNVTVDTARADMFKNPIGTLIFPSCILSNFNFKSISPKDASILSKMIRKREVSINGKQYSTKDVVMTYSLSQILVVSKFVDELKSTLSELNNRGFGDTMEVDIPLDSLYDYVRQMIYKSGN